MIFELIKMKMFDTIIIRGYLSLLQVKSLMFFWPFLWQQQSFSELFRIETELAPKSFDLIH